jgi:hypothetical protein
MEEIKEKRQQWIPKHKGKIIGPLEFNSSLVVDTVMSVFNQIEDKVKSEGDFVVEGLGKFYFMKGKSGNSYFKFNSKFKR